MPAVSLKVDDPGLLVAQAHDVVLLFWRKTPTADTVRMANLAIAEVVRVQPKIFQLVVISKQSGFMPAEGEARRQLERALKEQLEVFVAAVVVVEDQGFAAAALRGLLTGLQLIVKPPYPVKIVASRSEAQQALAAQGRAAESRALLTTYPT